MGSQRNTPLGSMQISQAAISSLGLLVILALGETANINDGSLYHVVEDIQGNETQDSVGGDVPTCLDVMAQNGLNFSTFWHGAAHGLHSLHLEEIRYFFEPNATEHNKIPVVNKNLSSQQIILFDAPLAGYDEHFETMAIKVMVYFMLNDRPDFFQQGLNTLEKLTHQYHMHEIYAAAAPIYKKMKQNPPTDPELCGCVNDITGNRILGEMANIARQLKYFQSRRSPRAPCGSFSLQAYLRAYGPCGDIRINLRRYQPQFQPQAQPQAQPQPQQQKREAEVPGFDEQAISQRETTYLENPNRETALRLPQVRPWDGNSLVGPEQWASYQAMLTASMLGPEQLNDFATFMYCRLNPPDIDHPQELFEMTK